MVVNRRQLENNTWVTLTKEVHEAGALNHLTKSRGAEASKGKKHFYFFSKG